MADFAVCDLSYDVRDIGPAKGYIFYDKGFDSDNWRYLEVAPSDIYVIDDIPIVYAINEECCNDTAWFEFSFGLYRTDLYNPQANMTVGTFQTIGSGELNTKMLVNAMGNKAIIFHMGAASTNLYAAKVCFNLVFGGYNDWFLQSIEELLLIASYIEELSTERYWSSSEAGGTNAYSSKFLDNSTYSRTVTWKVRPIRAF